MWFSINAQDSYMGYFLWVIFLLLTSHVWLSTVPENWGSYSITHRPKSPDSSSLVALNCDLNMSHVTEVHVLETQLILRTKMLKMACLYASLPLQRPQWLSTVFTTEVLTMDMGSVFTLFCKHSLACYSFIYRMMIKEASLKTLDLTLDFTVAKGLTICLYSL